MSRRLAVLPALILASLVFLLPGPASGQEAEGTISGRVRSGTEGAPLIDALVVELITLAQDGEITTQQATTRGGRFEFAAPADASLTQVLRAVYRGVQYFAPQAVTLSAELLSAEREIMVYETTSDPPRLRIDSTVLTVVALDRANAQLTLVREDMVVNPGDRTYTGDDRAITLRLPVPEAVIEADGRVVEASGLPDPGSFTLDGGRLATSAPLKPGLTLVVTRYLVGYDPVEDAYRLRVTAPLPTNRIELRVPTRFVGDMRPLDEATRLGERELEGERVLVVGREGGLRPGQGAIADLRGLAGRRAPNPLTERGGAALGSVLALLALGGGFAAFRALSNRSRSGGGPA